MRTLIAILLLSLSSGFTKEPHSVAVSLDVSESPELREWGEKAEKLIIEWHPRITNFVIQNYPNPRPIWVTEGIADYIRWAIYEGKQQSRFPIPKDLEGYKKGYQPAAGFLLWLETYKSPGIVRRLNTAMRNQQYKDSLFTIDGMELPSLWREYSKTK